MKKLPVEVQVLIGFTLALGLLIVMGALVYQSTRTVLQTHSAVQRSQQALIALEAIHSLMSQAESEQRLHFITGGDAGSAPSRAALGRVDELLAELHALVSDDPTLSAQVVELQQQVRARRRHLDWVLDGLRSGGIEEARRRLRRNTGRAEMQRLGEIVARLEALTLERLQARDQRVRADADRTVAFAVLLLLISLIAASALYLRIRREMRQRRQAQAELSQHARDLRESETRLHTILQTATDGIVVIDERGIIDRFNAAAERIFGYTASEVIGKNVSILMPSPDREHHDEYIQRYLSGGTPRIIGIGREVRAQRKDGTIFPMDLAVSAMRVDNRQMFTGIMRDITARKRVEEQRDQLIQELRAANDELTNFAYVVSHDLKAPLRAIASLAEWLEADYGDRLDEQGKEHLRLLRSRTQRMDRLIEGILEYSRIGRVKQTPAAVDLNATVRDTIDLLGPPPHVRIELPDDLPTVVGEPTRLQQLFQNLLSNAIKYLDKPQGVVRVGCQPDGDDMWRFSVSDNGPGIEARHHDRIFQLFQTLAPRDRVESTGVGLALVKKIVELYGGRVWVESTPGQGSTFYFTLPRAPQEQEDTDTQRRAGL